MTAQPPQVTSGGTICFGTTPAYFVQLHNILTHHLKGLPNSGYQDINSQVLASTRPLPPTHLPKLLNVLIVSLMLSILKLAF